MYQQLTMIVVQLAMLFAIATALYMIFSFLLQVASFLSICVTALFLGIQRRHYGRRGGLDYRA